MSNHDAQELPEAPDTSVRGEQRTPTQEGSLEATIEQKLEGLIEQMRADMARGIHEHPLTVLEQRLADARIQLEEEEFSELAARLNLR